MHSHLAIVLAGALAVVGFRLFYSWERRGRGVRTVFTILGVLLLDACIYWNSDVTQLRSIFHPGGLGGGAFRLTQALTVLGLAARLTARGFPRRIERPGMWWTAFFLWYATAAVAGVLRGNDSHLIASRGLFLVEAGGLMILVAGVPIADYLADDALPRFLRFAGILAAAMVVLATAGVQVSSNNSVLPLSDFGHVGPDAATLFPALGFIGLAMEYTRPRRRWGVLPASVVLVLSHAASSQRAARLDVVATILVFFLIALAPRARRFRIRGGELAVVAMVLAAVIAVPIFVKGVRGGSNIKLASAIPVVSSAVHVASSHYRQGSIQSRFNEWAAARPLIAQSPIVGQGLGKTFVHYDVGTRSLITFDETNNIILDLLLRTGVVGVVLFLAALASTVAAGLRAWSTAAADVAPVAAMATAVLAGFMAKGMVESVLNEYHLTPLLGLLAGLAISAAAASRTAPVARRELLLLPAA
jgi:O-antigen ligase